MPESFSLGPTYVSNPKFVKTSKTSVPESRVSGLLLARRKNSITIPSGGSTPRNTCSSRKIDGDDPIHLSVDRQQSIYFGPSTLRNSHFRFSKFSMFYAQSEVIGRVLRKEENP